MLKQILDKHGLTEKEINIYLCLLELGDQPASIIARKLNLPRSGCYLHLAKLCRQGLIRQIIKNKLTYYAINNTLYLLEQIQEERLQEIKQIETLKLNLQVKPQAHQDFSHNSCAHYYSGQIAISNLIKELLISQPTTAKIILSTNLFTTIKSADLIAASGQSCFILTTQKITNFEQKDYLRKLPAFFDLGVDLIINKQAVALICLPENFAILIESPLIAACQSKVFDLLWKFSRSF